MGCSGLGHCQQEPSLGFQGEMKPLFSLSGPQFVLLSVEVVPGTRHHMGQRQGRIRTASAGSICSLLGAWAGSTQKGTPRVATEATAAHCSSPSV